MPRGCARCSTRRGWAARVCVLGGISQLFIGYFEGLSSERRGGSRIL